MKKIILILFLLFTHQVYANSYHGIDIDHVYATSDWSSKDKIKEIIDDYALLSQYKQELIGCSQNANRLDCLDDLAKNILRHFYNNTEKNITAYENYVQATFAANAVIYCQNKYNYPAGTVCEQEKEARTIKMIEAYIKTLLSQTEQELNIYDFLKAYK